MKVYAALAGRGYEGYDEPLGIFTTAEQAENRLLAFPICDNYHTFSVNEYELDTGVSVLIKFWRKN